MGVNPHNVFGPEGPPEWLFTRNPSYKKRTKKWASLDLAFFVQSFLIFQVDLVKSFLVSSRFIKIKTLK